MALLTSFLLQILHGLYFVVTLTSACWKRLHRAPPLPLTAQRNRIPKHLAILFVTGPDSDLGNAEYTLFDMLDRVISWCRTVGIEKLTLYDSQGPQRQHLMCLKAEQNTGLLLDCASKIQTHLTGYPGDDECELTELDIEYPPTPPRSDYSDSRPLSPDNGLRPEPAVITIPVSERSKTRPRRQSVLRQRHTDRKFTADHLRCVN